jgi:hypothetical protein
MTFRLRSPKMAAKPTTFPRRMHLAVAFYLTAAVIAGLSPLMCAQEAPRAGVDAVVQSNIDDWMLKGLGLPDDWSHRHLVFSNPGTEQEAIENGTFEQWLKTIKNPRYTMQLMKRSGGVSAVYDEDVSPNIGPGEKVSPRRPVPVKITLPKATLEKDWNVAIGGAAASGTGTVTTNGATSTSTVTIDGVTLDASAPTAASATATFTGAPAAGQSVTIRSGSNALVLQTNASTASTIGTVSAEPTSTSAPTVTITNSATSTPNTLSLTTNATGATATGTISGSGPANGQTITITNGLTTNTLTLTVSSSAGTPGTATITVSNVVGAANGDTITIGNVVYTFEQSTSGSTFCSENTCPSNNNTNANFNCQTTTPCVWWGTTAANTAQAIYAAVTNNPAACPAVDVQGGVSVWQYTCYSYITAPNPIVTSTVATTTTPTVTGVVSLINISGSAAPFVTSSTQGAFTLSSTSGTIPAGSSNACTSATTGTVSSNSTPATEASYLAAAINSCNNSYPTDGVTASAVGSVVTVANTTWGSAASALEVGGNASNFVWSGVTAGSFGTNGCTSATAGTFATGSTTAATASNIAAAINSCNTSYPADGVTASYTSGNTFTVTPTTPGPFLAVSGLNLGSLYSWGSVSGGSAGTNSCTSSTSGTFASSSNTTTLASNLAAAIAACPAAAGVTASSSGAVLKVTASTAGSSGNSIAIANTLSNVNWSGSNLSGGTDGATTGTTFAYWSGAAAASTTLLAANIAAAINANTTLDTVVSATPVGSQVVVAALTPGTAANSFATTASLTGFAWGSGTLTGGLAGAIVQPNMYPAKYSFSFTTASCSDYVVYPTGTAGATHAASILAFSNLYTGGCSGTVPSAYWAYNTGGMVTTSPVLSLDGTQVAFVQNSGSAASLVLLKWAANNGTLSMPVTLSTQTASGYQSCTAPCMFTSAFSTSKTATFSAPYYDYTDDAIYVGDDSGNLLKFTGVFNGTPTAATSPWPVNLGANKLSPPVYDSGTGKVIVGDFGGILHSVEGATGVIQGSTVSVGDVIADAPLVDSIAGSIYYFVTTGDTNFDHNYNVVFELPTTFGLNTTPTAFKPVGTGATGYYFYAGTFDNVYYSSTTHTGSLYVVGNTGATTGANLYRIPITGSVMGTPVTPLASALTVNGARPWPSPLSEFCNNGANACTTSAAATTAGTDYIFFSVNRGNVGGCTNTAGNGCMLSYNISNPAEVAISGTGLNVTTPGTNGCWATSGLVIDNAVAAGTLAGASQTYFIGFGAESAGGPTGTTRTSSNCTAGTAGTISATQASQSNP